MSPLIRDVIVGAAFVASAVALSAISSTRIFPARALHSSPYRHTSKLLGNIDTGNSGDLRRAFLVFLVGVLYCWVLARVQCAACFVGWMSPEADLTALDRVTRVARVVLDNPFPPLLLATVHFLASKADSRLGHWGAGLKIGSVCAAIAGFGTVAVLQSHLPTLEAFASGFAGTTLPPYRPYPSWPCATDRVSGIGDVVRCCIYTRPGIYGSHEPRICRMTIANAGDSTSGGWYRLPVLSPALRPEYNITPELPLRIEFGRTKQLVLVRSAGKVTHIYRRRFRWELATASPTAYVGLVSPPRLSLFLFAALNTFIAASAIGTRWFAGDASLSLPLKLDLLALCAFTSVWW